MNSRITAKERSLIMNAMRRAFARSELRRQVMEASIIGYYDANRPRVKKWVTCNVCKKPTPKYSAVVDHIIPVIAVDSSFEKQGVEVTVDRMWCDKSNLQTICESCHTDKTSQERQERKRSKKK